jgi:hypothetical protein
MIKIETSRINVIVCITHMSLSFSITEKTNPTLRMTDRDVEVLVGTAKH